MDKSVDFDTLPIKGEITEFVAWDGTAEDWEVKEAQNREGSFYSTIRYFVKVKTIEGEEIELKATTNIPADGLYKNVKQACDKSIWFKSMLTNVATSIEKGLLPSMVVYRAEKTNFKKGITNIYQSGTFNGYEWEKVKISFNLISRARQTKLVV